jgi:CubicO group peptidase (beta-lactamase class C family)
MLAFVAMLGLLSPEARVDELFRQFTVGESPGCAVGVMREGKLILARGYGLANLEHGVPIMPATVFDIASASKQFTAASVVLLALRGRLSLDDDVRKHIPELPDYGKTITIRHLLHHTSGLRDYVLLMVLSGFDVDAVTNRDDALRVIARQKALNFDPGEDHLYSNSGYFLLSIIVERASGRSLREFAQENIFGPLGMKSTHYHDRHSEIVPRRATGYAQAPGGFRIAMSGWEQTGDGSVYTTIEDLLRWDNNFYDRKVGGAALYDTLLTRGALNNGKKLDYALGLYVRERHGSQAIFHGGSWAGYNAELIRFPERRLSVACLCNLAGAGAGELADKVAAAYLDVPAPAAAPALAAEEKIEETPLDEAELARYPGLYGDPATNTFRQVTVTGGKLYVETFNFGKFRMAPVGKDRFRVLGVPFHHEMLFRDGRFELLRDGTSYERLTRQEEPDLKALAEYAGVYECEELVGPHLVTANGRALSVRAGRTPLRTLQGVGKDTFLGGPFQFRFQRNAEGRVTGYMLDAGRVRGLVFLRKPERATIPPIVLR